MKIKIIGNKLKKTMKATIKITKEIDLKILRIVVPIDEEDLEEMDNDFPFILNDIWTVDIEIDTGRIIGWPKGRAEEVYLKVRDEGVYTLFDLDNNAVALMQDHYVPNNLVPPKDGYGDYLHFKINADGLIKNWYKKPSIKDFLEYFTKNN